MSDVIINPTEEQRWAQINKECKHVEAQIDPSQYATGIESTTCFTCADKTTCPFAGDPYNQQGDCLASK